MPEHIARPEHELVIKWGSVSLRVENAVELRQVIDGTLQATLTLDRFDRTPSPILESRLDFTAPESDSDAILSGCLRIDKCEEAFSSSTRVINGLIEYLLDECGFDENEIDTSVANNEHTVTVFPPDASAVHIHCLYENGDPTIVMYSELSQESNERYDDVLSGFNMWSALHDFVIWSNDEDTDATATELLVKQIAQPDAAYTLWQSLLDYEQWREKLDMPDLPVVDHRNMNLGRIGMALEAIGLTDYEDIHGRVRRTAAALRHFDKAVISEADVIVSTLT